MPTAGPGKRAEDWRYQISSGNVKKSIQRNMMNTAYTHLTTNLPQYPTIKSFDINQSNQKSSHKLYLYLH